MEMRRDVPLVIGEGRVKERVGYLERQPLADDSRAHAENVRIIVLTRCLGGEAVPAQGGSDAADLVRGHGHADTRAADDDAPVALAGCNGIRDRLCVDGVIAGCAAVGAEVLIFKPSFAEVLHQFFLKLEAAVIAAYRYHIHTS